MSTVRGELGSEKSGVKAERLGSGIMPRVATVKTLDVVDKANVCVCDGL